MSSFNFLTLFRVSAKNKKNKKYIFYFSSFSYEQYHKVTDWGL